MGMANSPRDLVGEERVSSAQSWTLTTVASSSTRERGTEACKAQDSLQLTPKDFADPPSAASLASAQPDFQTLPLQNKTQARGPVPALGPNGPTQANRNMTNPNSNITTSCPWFPQRGDTPLSAPPRPAVPSASLPVSSGHR